MLLYIAVCVCSYQSPGVAMRSELALLELLMRRALWVILALWVAALASRNKLLFRRRCLWLVDWGDFSSVTDILWTSYPVDRKQQKNAKAFDRQPDKSSSEELLERNKNKERKIDRFSSNNKSDSTNIKMTDLNLGNFSATEFAQNCENPAQPAQNAPQTEAQQELLKLDKDRIYK